MDVKKWRDLIKKELIVSYEKSEWQLLQKTMENTIIKACAYVQKK